MESKASLNMPRVSARWVTPFWLDLFFVSVAGRLAIEVNSNRPETALVMLQREPVSWLVSQSILYSVHLMGAYILLPAFLRHDYPKATLLLGALLAWFLILMPMSGHRY